MLLTHSTMTAVLARLRLRPSDWEALESPLAAIGIGLAAAMAACPAEP